MSISHTPQNRPFPSWYTEELQPSVSRFSALPTPASMKTGALFGIPLKSYLTNEVLSDEAIQRFINEAISQIEHELDLYITPVKFDERHDYNRHQFTWSFAYLKLKHSSILNVEKCELTFNNAALPNGFITFPLEFVIAWPEDGVIQLVPAFGTDMSGFLMSSFSGAQYQAMRALGIENFPGAFHVIYTAGFEQNKVPALLTSLIELLAAYKLLSVMGPILMPHNGVSINIDGVGQSVSTLGPAFLANRLKDLQGQIDAQMDAAKGYYCKKWLIDNI